LKSQTFKNFKLLQLTLQQLVGRVWNGLIWLGIRSNGGLLWMQ